MNLGSFTHDFFLRVMPMNSNRRMLSRTIKEVFLNPTTVIERINLTNIKNFLRYRKQVFHCPVCGKETFPLYDFPNVKLRREHKIGVLRETLQCRECFSSMRQRSLALAILEYWEQRTSIHHTSIAALAEAGIGNVRILDTDNFSAISELMEDVPGYFRCSYLPERPWGIEIEKNYYNINLECIDFDAEEFDIVLTSDVMEHVRNCDSAHNEIYRVLRRGGAYIFNVPYDEFFENDIQLVDTTSAENVYLCEPQLHGDPLTGGVLAYRVFGRELIGKLQSLGFQVCFQRMERRENLIVDGDVFIAIKQR